MDDQNKGVNERGAVRGPVERGYATDPQFTAGEYAVDPSQSPPTREEGPEGRTREIRAEIDRTREEMTETIDAIQDRLSPRRMVSRAADNVREATVERVRHMANTVHERFANDSGANAQSGFLDRTRENPVATALAVGSLAWLVFGGRRRGGDDFSPAIYGSTRDGEAFIRETRIRTRGDGQDRDAFDRHGDADPRGHAGTVLGRAQSAARSAGSQAEESIHEASTRVRAAARQGRRRAARLQDENPLAAGAIAAGIGLAIGLAIPETERENELMGEARDSLMDKGRETVRGAAARIQGAAEGVQRAAATALNATTPEGEVASKSDGADATGSQGTTPAGMSAAASPTGDSGATGDAGTRKAGRTRRAGSTDVTGADNP
jgi:ElaB/YqjD/DUF883 family membrane-anchored ribosome-binding protein